MIRVTNLTKRYGARTAVDRVSFHVEKGSIVGFLGPNGAGKSTTIRVLTAYLPATSGSASVAGFDVFSQSMEVRRRIGYLPESAPLYPDMRVREYLHFRGKLRGMDLARRTSAIRSVVDRCRLGEFIDRPIGQLSKGMRQRAGLADAIMHDPEVLILDEPTIGLDPTQIRETRNLIKDLGARHTILISSHILHEIEQICSKAIIIASGRIVSTGSPKQLRERFSAKSHVVAEVKGPGEDVRKSIGALNGVSGVELSMDNGWARVNIETKRDCDVREDVFRLTTKQGWALRELRTEGATLEDFFIEVTRKQQEHDRAA